MARPRKARDTLASREALIDAAERLFGEHGLDGVSFRQITIEAGALNNFAVQYHFGDKAGLIRAIFERRLAAMELRRAALLSEAKRAGRLGDVETLIQIIFRPIVEQVDQTGRHTYAAFLLALEHAGDDSRSRAEVSGAAPIAEHVIDLLTAALPHIPMALFAHRMKGVTTGVLVGVVRQTQPASLPAEMLFEDSLVVAAAALSAHAPNIETPLDNERLALN
jgi:AcrR family transcriptional regulator